MATSLDDYYDVIFWVNYLVYIVYFLVKYPVATILWIVLKCAESDRTPISVDKYAKPMQWFVLLVFSKQLEPEQKEEKLGANATLKNLGEIDASEELGGNDPSKEQGENGVSTASKGNGAYHPSKEPGEDGVNTASKRLGANGIPAKRPKIVIGYRSTIVFFILIVAFGVLAVGSALDLTLLIVTHICTEDPYIDCYPQLISGANDSGVDITTDKPIQDCTFWNSKGVSNRVTFVCYQLDFNVELFLAIVGGLLAFFVYTMKTAIQVLLFLSVSCLDGGCQDKNTCMKIGCVIRIAFTALTSVIEIVLVVVGMVLGATGSRVDNTNDTPELIFFATHGAEILLIFGIIATLLWLPWEDYAIRHKVKEPTKSQEYEMDRIRQA